MILIAILQSFLLAAKSSIYVYLGALDETAFNHLSTRATGILENAFGKKVVHSIRKLSHVQIFIYTLNDVKGDVACTSLTSSQFFTDIKCEVPVGFTPMHSENVDGSFSFSKFQSHLDFINLAEGWKYSQGDDQIVGVLDSGCDVNHHNVKRNMWKNPGELPRNNIDDDGNGYVDDIYGINVAEDGGAVALDMSGHGSFVAGEIAGSHKSDFYKTVDGIVPKAKIMCLRVIPLTIFEGIQLLPMVAHVVEAINYMISTGIKISNNSYSTPRYSHALERSIRIAGELYDHLFISAAGNDGKSMWNSRYLYKPQYPCGYKLNNTICVGNYDHKKHELSVHSNYGSGTVDIAAPGTSIVGINSDYDILENVSKDNYPVTIKSGTSMASPLVAGAVALLRSMVNKYQVPNTSEISATQIRSIIMTSGCRTVTALQGRISNKVACGGVLDVGAAVSALCDHKDMKCISETERIV